MKEVKKISIPKEIVAFFSKEGGHSLLVEGGAGTGKSTFSLQLLEEIADPEKSFYLTTRVSDQALYNQFPWLKDKEMRSRIVDSSRILLDALYRREEKREEIHGEEKKRVTTARDFLKSIKRKEAEAPKEVDRARLNLLLEKAKLPEIERLYDKIESILPEQSLLTIDSVEGLTHKYNINQEEFVAALQKDLVENSNTNLVLVLEKLGASHLEYIVDGVISFSRMELDKRRVREIHLTKLRATEIGQPSYLVTLRNGRFTCFEPYTPDFAKPPKWDAISDNSDHYSTGVADLDNLLGGGFPKGSYNVLEVAENVSGEEYYSIIRPILMNFVTQSRGVVAVLSGGDHAETLRNDLTRFVSGELFDRYVRIVDYFVQQSTEPYIMALGTKNREEAMKIYKDNITMLRGKEDRPIIDYTGLDTVEYLHGGDVAIKNLLNAVAKIKISKEHDLGIGLLKPGLKLTQEIMNMADTYLKIVDIDKSPCIYGIKPKTMIHAIVPDETKGCPFVKLIPIV